jgi:hypothetical protein
MGMPLAAEASSDLLVTPLAYYVMLQFAAPDLICRTHF